MMRESYAKVIDSFGCVIYYKCQFKITCEDKMLIAIIIISLLTMAGLITAIISLAGFISNFNKDTEKRKKYFYKTIIFMLLFFMLGGINSFLIVKYVYNNRQKIGATADALVKSTIDKTAEYSARGALASVSTYKKAYNANIIKQFENLDMSVSSSTFETKDGEKVYEIELLLDNKIPQNEEIYFGNLVAKNYVLACDANDFVYDIVPLDTDAGFSSEEGLISLFEFLLDREYTKYGKILPGKTKHKILVKVPEDVSIVSVRFLDKQMDIH
jgi:hypothetical protein